MRVRKARIVDVCLLVLVNTLWAAQYTAYKVATGKMGPLTVSAWTFLISSLVLLPFLGWDRRQAKASALPPVGAEILATPPARWTGRNLRALAVAGVLGLVPGSVLLAWGVDRSTASNAAIIYLTLPVFTSVLAAILLGERMTRLRWVSLAIALGGVLILSTPDLAQLHLARGQFLLGNLLVLLACLGSSLYNVYCKDLLNHFSPLEVLIYGYALAFAAILLLMPWAEPISPSSIAAYGVEAWIALLVLSVFSWGLAMVLWMFLLKRLDVSQASVSIYLMPFLGVVISAITLHETIGLSTLAGGLLTLAGTILITTLEPSTA